MTALDRTRGPWTVAPGANVHPYVVVGPDENHVAGTYTTKRTRAECEANARLIASGPDMLAELRRDLRLAQEVVTFLAVIGATGDVLHTHARQRIDALKETIARAEGERT